MRPLCFGGSFNPIHVGHLICARAVAEARGFDRVILIPASIPPHKPDSQSLAPARHRLEMCKLAAAVQPGLFEVSEVEINRPGPSYAIDTARALRAAGHSQVNWLIGADMLLYLPNWHEPQALLREVNFVIVRRPGWNLDFSTLSPPYRSLSGGLVDAPLIDVSSTAIRRRVVDGKSIAYLTPGPVVEYIHQHGLYLKD